MQKLKINDPLAILILKQMDLKPGDVSGIELNNEKGLNATVKLKESLKSVVFTVEIKK